MNHVRKFETAEQLMTKAALMDKVIEGIKSYRPFNIDDASGATGTSALVGGGLGALLGGGSAAIQGAFMDDEDEEGRKVKKPSILGRALLGAGAGSIGGAILPHAGVGLSPYISREIGKMTGKHMGEKIDAKWPASSGGNKLTDSLRQHTRDKAVGSATTVGRMLSTEALPQLTIGDIIEQLRNPKKVEINHPPVQK